MPRSSLVCPWCQLPLRIRDRSLNGQTVACPSCQQPVRLSLLDRQGADWNAAKPESEQARVQETFLASQARTMTAFKQAATSLQSLLETPLALSIVLMTSATLIGVIWLLRTERSLPGVVEKQNPGDTTGILEPTTLPNSEGTAVPPSEVTVQSRLDSLGRRLQLPLQDGAELPRGAVAADPLASGDRFSWLAALQAPHATAADVKWDQPWHAVNHDRFVRRKVDEYLNPTLTERVAEDGRPATHFVGISGIGTDAAELPTGHPRAGAFGASRKVKREDFRDGLSDTMIVAGVSRRLGSWAAGGSASIRSFNEEPYVNGPDGFGTGQLESMQVLMADGSVRTVSKNVAGTVIRRMASLADGLPLDPEIPGDPTQLPAPIPLAKPDAVPPQNHPPVEPPAAVVAPPKAPVINLNAALSLKIASFKQSRPTPVRELLEMIEELLGASISIAPEFQEQLSPKLTKPITLELKNTSVGELLRAILKPIDADFRLDGPRIELIPRAAVSAPEK